MHILATSPPVELGGFKLVRLHDFQKREMRSIPGGAPLGPLNAPGQELLFAEAESENLRLGFAARPSGTEAKLKFYTRAEAGRTDRNSLPELKVLTGRALARLEDALIRWARTILAQ